MNFKKPLKRASALVLAGALTMNVFSDSSYAAAKTFPDSINHWAKNVIDELASKGIIDGYSDGTIRPDNQITRAEFAKLLATSIGAKTDASASKATTFNDINGSFAKQYIETLVKQGAIKPSEIGKSFKPNEKATRIFQIQLLVNSLGKNDLAAKMTGKTSFKDDAKLLKKDKGYINVAKKYKITSGFNDNTIQAYSNSTRAQSFALVQRRQVVLDEIEKEKPNAIVGIEAPKFSDTETSFNVKASQTNVKSISWSILLKDNNKQVDPKLIEGNLTSEGGKIRIKGPGTYVLSAKTLGTNGKTTTLTKEIEIGLKPSMEIKAEVSSIVGQDIAVKTVLKNIEDDKKIDWVLLKEGKQVNWSDYIVGTLTNEGGTISFKQNGAFTIMAKGATSKSQTYTAQCFITVFQPSSPSYPQAKVEIDAPDYSYTDTSFVISSKQENVKSITWSVVKKEEKKLSDKTVAKKAVAEDTTSLIPAYVEGSFNKEGGEIKIKRSGDYIITAEVTNQGGQNTKFQSSVHIYDVPLLNIELPERQHAGAPFDIKVKEAEHVNDNIVNWSISKQMNQPSNDKNENDTDVPPSITKVNMPKVDSKTEKPSNNFIESELNNAGGTATINEVGQYVVNATIVDEHNRTFVTKKYIEITNEAPTKPTLKHNVTRTFKDGKFLVPIEFESLDSDGDKITFEFEGKSEDNYYELGEHKVKARALDEFGGISDWAETTFAVINTAPDKPTISADVTKDYKDGKFLVPLTVNSKDPENDEFTFEFEGKEDNDRYAVGKHQVKVRAVDEFGFASEWSEVTFDVINTAPTTPVVDATVTRTFKDGKFYVPITFSSTDAEGDAIFYEFEGRDAEDCYAVGKHTVRVRAVDPFGGVSDWTEIQFELKNSAPTAPTISVNVTREYKDGKFKVPITVGTSKDEDGDKITYEFEGKADDDFYGLGEHTVKVRAKDDYNGVSDWAEVTFNVRNSAPSDVSISADVTHTYKNGKFYVPLTFSAKDEDRDPIHYEFKGRTDDDYYSLGEHTVKVRAYDDYDGYSDWKSVTFKITNAAPTNVTISHEVTRTYKDGKFFVPIKVTAVDDDNTVDEIQFEFKNKSEDDYYPVGTHTVSVRAYDPFDSYSEWVDTTFTVHNSNPEKPAISADVTREYKSGKFKVPVTYSSTDADGDEITYEFEGKAADDFYSLGEHTVKVRAKDNYNGVSEWSEVTFKVQNSAPTNPAVNAVTTRDFVNGKARVNVSYSSIDADGDTIEYEVEGKASDNRYAIGTYTIRVRAKDAYDGVSEWVEKQFTIMNSAPTTPVMSKNPSGNPVAPGTTVKLTANSTDADGDPIRYIWENRPSESYMYGPGKQVVRVKAIDSAGEESPWAAMVFFVADNNGNGGAILNGPDSTINENGIDGATITSYTFTVPPVDGHSSSNDYGRVRGFNKKTNTWEQLNYQPTTNGVTLKGTMPAGTYTKLEFYYYTDHDCMYGKSNITYSVDYYFE